MATNSPDSGSGPLPTLLTTYVTPLGNVLVSSAAEAGSDEVVETRSVKEAAVVVGRMDVNKWRRDSSEDCGADRDMVVVVVVFFCNVVVIHAEQMTGKSNRVNEAKRFWSSMVVSYSWYWYKELIEKRGDEVVAAR